MTIDTKKTASIPGHVCPGCERFIGPADTCPYCGADSAKHPALRVLRYAALLLAVAGLGFLYLMVTHRDVPVIKVGEITPMMNFAYARVLGTVERKAYVAKKKGKVDYLSFSVDDGSGQLRVAAYRDVARSLVEKKLVPEKGALVDVAGSLRVSEDRESRLYIHSSDQLSIIVRRAQ